MSDELSGAEFISEGVGYEKVEDHGDGARSPRETVSMSAFRNLNIESDSEADKAVVVTPEDSDDAIEALRKTEAEKIDPIGESEEEETEDAGEEEGEEQRASDEADEGEEEASEEEEVLEGEAKRNWKPKNIPFVDDKGEKVKVSNNAEVQISVDGKKVRLPLQEVLNRASGDIAAENRLLEANQRVKESQDIYQQTLAEVEKTNKEIRETNETHKKLMELASAGSPEKLLIYAARKSGQDPLDVIKTFINDSMKAADTFSGMTETQRQQWLNGFSTLIKEQELSEREAALSAKDEEEQRRAQDQQFETWARGEMAKYSVSEADITNTVKLLEQKGIALPTDSKENRVETIFDYIHEQRIYEAARQVDESLLQNTELLQEVYDLTSNGHKIRTVEKLAEVLEKFSNKDAAKKKKRIARNLSKKELNGTSKRQTKASEQEIGPMGFHDFRRKHHGF